MLDIISTVLSYAVPFLFIFMLVVFFHELGHFLIARWNGVHVEVFSIGMGRPLVSWEDSYGTIWKLAWMPLGGYCKMRGEEDGMPKALVSSGAEGKQETAEFYEGCYDHKNVYARMAIASAGPIANFLLAIAIFWGIFYFTGINTATPQVSKVVSGSPAEEAGFQTGDIIRAIEGEAMMSPADINRVFSFAAGERLQVDVIRDDRIEQLFVVPRLGTLTDRFGNQHRSGMIGVHITALEQERRALGMVSAFSASLERTGMVISMTFGYLWQLIAGKQDASNLAGPIRIVQISSQVASDGIIALLGLAAILSISLGIVNLFPIPVLDGGHILFYLIEMVKGSPLSQRIQDYSMRVGLLLILGLMIFVTLNDLLHLGLFANTS